jgi:hypothetical protein
MKRTCTRPARTAPATVSSSSWATKTWAPDPDTSPAGLARAPDDYPMMNPQELRKFGESLVHTIMAELPQDVGFLLVFTCIGTNKSHIYGDLDFESTIKALETLLTNLKTQKLKES